MTSPGTAPEDWEAFIQWPASPSPTDTTGTISALSKTSPLTLPPDDVTSCERAELRISHDSGSTLSEENIVAVPDAFLSTPLGHGSTSRTHSNSVASVVTNHLEDDIQQPRTPVRGLRKLAHNRLLAPKPGAIAYHSDEKFVHYAPHGIAAKKPKTRNKFGKDKRKETAQIRKDGSCVSCRLRKVRVCHQRSRLKDRLG